MKKHTFIGLLAAAAVAFLAGIWFGAEQDIVLMDIFSSSSQDTMQHEVMEKEVDGMMMEGDAMEQHADEAMMEGGEVMMEKEA